MRNLFTFEEYTMNLKPLVIAISLTGVAGTCIAAEPVAIEQKRGAVAGFIIGSLGGPLGATVGTIAGAEVFGRLFATKRINRELKADLVALHTNHKQERDRFNKSIRALNKDLDKLIAFQGKTAKKHALGIQFRTGSSEIEAHYQTELLGIAQLLHRNRDASVTLTGFADRRGDSDFNQQLSEQRADTVRQYLLGHGVKNQQMLTVAYGESKPLQKAESLENNFFDRRVMLELSLDIDPQLATR